MLSVRTDARVPQIKINMFQAVVIGAVSDDRLVSPGDHYKKNKVERKLTYARVPQIKKKNMFQAAVIVAVSDGKLASKDYLSSRFLRDDE